MASDKRIKIRIDDMNFYVVGGDNEEYVRALAKTLNRKISETRRANHSLNQVQSLMLTSLNILDEKEKLEQQEEIINTTSKDEIEVKNRLKELEDVKKEVSEFEDTKEELDKKLSDYSNKIEELEKEEENYIKLIKEKDERIEELIEKLNQATFENKKLEGEIYDSQKMIIDLNREIESLTDEEE